MYYQYAIKFTKHICVMVALINKQGHVSRGQNGHCIEQNYRIEAN